MVSNYEKVINLLALIFLFGLGYLLLKDGITGAEGLMAGFFAGSCYNAMTWNNKA